MNAPMTQPNGPEGLVQALLETLDDERETLLELGKQFKEQLSALRTSPEPVGEEAVHAAGEVLDRLGRCRAARDRHVRLLRRVLHLEADDATLADVADALPTHPALASYRDGLLNAREAVRSEARQARQACEDLDFALRYAAELGHELIQAAHDQMAPAAPQTYTASGRKARPTSRSLLNHLG